MAYYLGYEDGWSGYYYNPYHFGTLAYWDYIIGFDYGDYDYFVIYYYS